jgi:hypothetical protein
MRRRFRVRVRGPLALATLVAVVAHASVARAHVVSDRELRVVASMPADSVTRALAACVPDGAGFVAPHRAGGALDLGRQRLATLPLIVAAARGDSAGAERAWRAIEPGFVAVRDTRAGDPAARLDRAAWAGSTCRAFIAVMNSPLQDRFRMRYAALKPQLQALMDTLELDSGSLLATHAGRGGALLVIAAAFVLADGTFHDGRYARVGQAALAEALTLQRPDGAFLASGRVDPREHALGLEALQSIAIYFPAPHLDRAVRRAASWLAAHRPSDRAPTRRGASRAIAAVGPGEAAFVIRYAAVPPPPAPPDTTGNHEARGFLHGH